MRRVFQTLCFIALVLIITYTAYGMWREFRLPNGLTHSPFSSIDIPSLPTAPLGSYTEQGIATTYEGYSAVAKLWIPKIDLQVYVLEPYSEETLAVSATQFYGPSPNEIGNFCIAGHNYNRENMFNHLIDLSVGDILFLTDNQHGRGTYRIYDIYKVVPTEVSPLSQDTNGNTEVTLITCTNYSSRRLIVKAVKI